MAVTLEEFELKLKSEIAAAGSKDVAALQRVDDQIKAAKRSLEAYQAAAKPKAAAFEAQSNVVGGLKDQLAAARSRVAELSNSGTPPAMLLKAKEQAADLAGKLEQAQGKLEGLRGAMQSANAKAATGAEGVDALQAARPRLEALARERQAVKDNVVAQAQAAKQAKRDQAQADKDAKRAAEEAAKDFREQQESASKAAFAFKGAIVEAGIEVTKYAALLFAVATVAVTAFVLKVADAARSLRILGGALTGNQRLGDEFVAVVNQLAERVPLAKDQIASLAKELELMRLGRRDMQAGLTAIAVVTSALGDSAGGAIKAIVASTAATRRFSLGARDLYGEFTALAGTGLKKADVLGALAKQLGKSLPEVEQMLLRGQVSVKDGLRALEAAAEARFGKTIAAQMLSLDVQFQKAKENLETLFAGVAIEPVLEGLKTMLSVLDHNTATGRALQVVLTAAFSALGAAVTVVAPIAKTMFQGMIIGALRMYIALRPVARGFMAIGEAVAGVLGWIAKGLGIDALEAGKFAAFALAAAFALVGVAIFLAFLPLLIVGALVVVALYAIYKVVDGLIGVFTAVYDYVSSLDLGQAASDLISGLVTGIVANAAAVIAAMENLAGSAIDAFKAKLGIASPSKVFAEFGGYIAEGTAQGVEGGTADVAGATADMGGAAVTGAGAGAAAAGGGGSGPRAVVPIYLFPGGPFLRNLVISVVNDEIDIATDAAGAGFAPGVI